MQEEALKALENGPKNRTELVETLDQLRVQGLLEESEEATLLRHYDDMQREYKEQLARVEPEYKRRLEADGKNDADTWLAETVTELGRKAGEATRRTTDQLRVVTG